MDDVGLVFRPDEPGRIVHPAGDVLVADLRLGIQQPASEATTRASVLGPFTTLRFAMGAELMSSKAPAFRYMPRTGVKMLFPLSCAATKLQISAFDAAHQIHGNIAREIVDHRGKDPSAVIVQRHGALLGRKRHIDVFLGREHQRGGLFDGILDLERRAGHRQC